MPLEDAAIRVLRRQRWPGNVRQLENFIERLVVLAKGPIDVALVEAELLRKPTFATEPASAVDVTQPRDKENGKAGLRSELRLVERKALERALEQAGGNRTEAARLLGVSRSHLYSMLDEHGLT